MTKGQLEELIMGFAGKVSVEIKIPVVTLCKIVQKAIDGGEINVEQLPGSLDGWYKNRFSQRLVYIDEEGYAKMCIDALKILNTTVASDYGSSRQRDFGQIWGDMTRGYLAEFALAKFLKQKWDIDVELGHEVGELADYLPADIHTVHKPGEQTRQPNLKIGIKGSKWNGIWLDVPGAQFHHSDMHIFVKVGTSRDHLFAYFKHISVFKDKILAKGVETGSLTQDEAQNLLDLLPTFEPVPAYITGFVPSDLEFKDLDYKGYKGRTRFTISGWNGPLKPGDVELVREKEGVAGTPPFEGIGKFSHENGYLFNTGSLLWKDEDWQERIIKKI